MCARQSKGDVMSNNNSNDRRFVDRGVAQGTRGETEAGDLQDCAANVQERTPEELEEFASELETERQVRKARLERAIKEPTAAPAPREAGTPLDDML